VSQAHISGSKGFVNGGTENARPENAGSKNAGPNARMENAELKMQEHLGMWRTFQVRADTKVDKFCASNTMLASHLH